MTDPPLLIYQQTCDHLLLDPLDPRPGPRHALRADPYPEEHMARHGDDDADGLANQADPDWRPDQRDEHAHDDEACDQQQEQPDRWVGVTRDPDLLPVPALSPDEYDPEFFDG